MRSLKLLSKWLTKHGFEEEGSTISSMIKKASTLSYTVRAGDTLSGIAEKFGTTIKEIQSANNMKEKTVIYEGKKLKIPKTAPTDDEIVAMTLLGEGGSGWGVPIMKEVFAVIKNRAECRGKSLKEIVLEKNQFSYWNSRDPGIVFYSKMGKDHSMFERALQIVEKEEAAASVGKSTHYYVFDTRRVSERDRNYKDRPSWADENNPRAKWTEIYKGSHHTYGIDRSIRHYKNCPSN